MTGGKEWIAFALATYLFLTGPNTAPSKLFIGFIEIRKLLFRMQNIPVKKVIFLKYWEICKSICDCEGHDVSTVKMKFFRLSLV